jgi:hypothetical protein
MINQQPQIRQMKTMITMIASGFLAACAGGGSTAGASSENASVASVPVAKASPVKAYPKDTCIVSDNELGSMGKPVTKVYGNQEVKFCCKPCIKKFEADPQRYLRKL